MCQCIHREVGADWAGGKRSLSAERHDVRSQASEQSPMGVGCPGPEKCREGPAKAGRGGVDRSQEGNKPKSSHPPVVLKEYRERCKARFCSKERHRSGPEKGADPSLHLSPMDLHLAVKAFGGCEQVSPV